MRRGGSQTVRLVIQQAPAAGIIGNSSLGLGSTSPAPANDNRKKFF